MVGHRFLLVEDHEGTRQAFRGLLTQLGWHVSAAESVRDGLALLESEPEPCCLVLDLDLPDGHGEEVLRRLREKGLRTRVVVCSGSMDDERLRRVAALSPDALLTKPVTLSDVWSGLCRVCGVPDPRPKSSGTE